MVKAPDEGELLLPLNTVILYCEISPKLKVSTSSHVIPQPERVGTLGVPLSLTVKTPTKMSLSAVGATEAVL